MKAFQTIFAIVFIILSLAGSANALQLSETNLIVVRAGDGIESLTNTGNSCFFDEYTTAGNYVGSVAIPDSGPNGVAISGTLFEESYLNRSMDSRFLCLPVYGIPVGTTNDLTSNNSTNVPRVVLTIDHLGNYQKIIVSTNLYSGLAWRCVATDGTNNFWCAGSGVGTIYLSPAGAQTVIQNTKPNCRVTGIFNGHLYMASASAAGDSKTGIYQFAGLSKTLVGLPAPIIFTNTFNTPSGICDFSVNPAGSIIYFADERTNNGIQGGIQRWDLKSGVWSNTYHLTNGLGTFGTSYLTTDWSGPNPILYAVTEDTTNGAFIPNRLVKVIDTGAGSLFTILATASPHQLFRGVRFGPVAASPSLNFAANGGQLILSWPAEFSEFTLQSTTNFPPASWGTVPSVPAIINGQNTVTDFVSGQNKFYRLSY